MNLATQTFPDRTTLLRHLKKYNRGLTWEEVSKEIWKGGGTIRTPNGELVYYSKPGTRKCFTTYIVGRGVDKDNKLRRIRVAV